MDEMGAPSQGETPSGWDPGSRGYPVAPGLLRGLAGRSVDGSVDGSSGGGATPVAGGLASGSVAGLAGIRTVHLLGSTGSIGTQAADIVRANPDRFRVTGLAARAGDPTSLATLIQQVLHLRPEVVAVAHRDAADAVHEASRGVEVIVGPDAAAQLAQRPVDVSLNALAGAAGLPCTLAALRAGSVVALANKESLVIGGALVTALAAPGQIVPVDSEHSALAQCLWAGTRAEVARLVLTASGGAFRNATLQQLQAVTVEQALRHPNWSMGPLVTVNSATMVNKGLEVIEAHLLFAVAYDHIDVVIHPQQVIHSMVEFVDGSTIAQASPPDMHLPIALALAWPDRVAGAGPRIDWASAATWEFEPVDAARFPAVGLAFEVGRRAGTYPAVFNAANEAAVAAFLAGALPFMGIVPVIERVLAEHDNPAADSIDAVLQADAWARSRAGEVAAAR